MIVRFLADYIFTPDEDRRVSVKYRARWQGRVRAQCAQKAIAAGAAEAVAPPAPAKRERRSRAKAAT